MSGPSLRKIWRFEITRGWVDQCFWSCNLFQGYSLMTDRLYFFTAFIVFSPGLSFEFFSTQNLSGHDQEFYRLGPDVRYFFMGSDSSFATKLIQSIRFLKSNFSAILTWFVWFGIRTRDSTAAVQCKRYNNNNTVIQLCLFLWMPSDAISCDCKEHQQ